MLNKGIRIISLFMSLILVLSGCMAVDTSSEGGTKKKVVYVIEDDEINYYYSDSNNNSNNNNDNINSSNPNTSSSDNTTEEDKPISSGEWKQERFYLSSCIVPNDYESLVIYKEAGFNLAEGAGKGDDAAFDLVKNANKVGGIYVLANNKFRFTLDAGLAFNEKSVKNAVNKYAALDTNRLIMGYTVWDEPVLNDDFFARANRMIGFLNKYDPNSLKFINLLPSYGVYTWDSSDINSAFGDYTYEEYVEEFIKGVDPQVVSLDYYPYLMNQAGYTGDWFRDMGLFRKLCAKYEKPFWYYYQVVPIAASKAKPTTEQVLYQMYVGLAYGAKSLMAWNQDVSSGGKKTEYFEQTKARNFEIMPVGTYLLDKTTTEIYHTGTAGNYFERFYLDKLSDSNLIASAPTNMILSVFEDGKTNTKYLLVVNKDVNNSVKGDIKLKTNKNIGIFNRNTEKEDSIGSGDTISIDIKPGGGEIYILK